MPQPSPETSTLCLTLAAGMVLHAALLLAWLAATTVFMRRAVQRDTPFTSVAPKGTVPVMVPVGNVATATEPSLRSLLEQEGIDYRVIFITATKDEEAAKLIANLCDEYTHASHLVAGQADRNAQKNHNLLTGITATTDDDDILVFCDSTHAARPDFLARLLTPVAAGETHLASGYRFVRPGDERMGTLLHMIAIQSLHMLFAIKPISQPWGGATAIRRSTFFAYDVPALWETTVLDDYTMGPYLAGRGIRSLPVAEACLETHLSGQTVSGASNWFFRQIHFAKYYTPLTWALGTLLPLFFLFIFGFAAVCLVAPLMPLGRTIALCYFIILTLIGLRFTQVLPNHAGPLKRVAAFFLFSLTASVQYLRTWTTNTIVWQNIRYRMRRDGQVVEVIRRDRS